MNIPITCSIDPERLLSEKTTRCMGLIEYKPDSWRERAEPLPQLTTGYGKKGVSVGNCPG